MVDVFISENFSLSNGDRERAEAQLRTMNPFKNNHKSCQTYLDGRELCWSRRKDGWHLVGLIRKK